MTTVTIDEVHDVRSPSLLDRAGTWWMILRICIQERLVYRGDFALGTLMRFLPILTQIFLWKAIFQARGNETIAGYTYDDMVAYYVLTYVSRAFSSMPGLATNIAAQIRSGEIKKYLIQPVDLVGFLLLSRIAHKLVYFAIAAGPYALLIFVLSDYFPGWPEPHVLLAYFASLIMSFLLGFFLEAALGLVGFWFLEVSSLFFVYMLFNFFLSGHMFPLDIVPAGWGAVLKVIPLQYLAYFPAAVALGKVQGQELAIGLGVQATWVLFFIGMCRFSLTRGIKRYSGYGG